MKLEFSQHIFEKWPNLKFHDLSFMKICPVAPSCSMGMHGQTDRAKIIVTFHNYANVPKNVTCDILVFNYCVLEV
jgi:hypothetical protein